MLSRNISGIAAAVPDNINSQTKLNPRLGEDSVQIEALPASRRIATEPEIEMKQRCRVDIRKSEKIIDKLHHKLERI